MNKTIKKIVIMFTVFLLVSSQVDAYYQYVYQADKLYYFDDKVYDYSGWGYAGWAAILSMNTPAILGVIGIVGGVGVMLDQRDYVMGSAAVGLGGYECYLQTLNDKTISNWLNGSFVVGMVLSGLIPTKEQYPPKEIFISSNILYRSDIKLNYADAEKIYFELMDKGYIEHTPYQARLTKKFKINEKIVLSEPLEKFSDYTQWVLTQVSVYNETGKNPLIVFESPPTSNNRSQ